MKIAFELSMPSNNSWNGKWSGADNCYAVIESFTTIKARQRAEKLVNASFCHSFGDGWVACVSTRIVSDSEAKTLKRNSKGFCGYDWMIDSILEHGEIRA